MLGCKTIKREVKHVLFQARENFKDLEINNLLHFSFTGTSEKSEVASDSF